MHTSHLEGEAHLESHEVYGGRGRETGEEGTGGEGGEDGK